MSEGKKSKSTKDLKEEFVKARLEEIKSYYPELTDFLNERSIDIDATVTFGERGNEVNIVLIDRL